MNRQTMRKLIDSGEVRNLQRLPDGHDRRIWKTRNIIDEIDLSESIRNFMGSMTRFSETLKQIDLSEPMPVRCDDGKVRLCRVQRFSAGDPVFVTECIVHDEVRGWVEEHPLGEVFLCSYYNSADDWGIFYRFFSGYVLPYLYADAVREMLNPAPPEHGVYFKGFSMGRIYHGGSIFEGLGPKWKNVL